MTAPIEGKVWSAANGGTGGAVVGTFVLWLLGITVWGAPSDALGAVAAVAAVPSPVVGLVGLGAVYGGAMAAGYRAKHTARPMPEADPPAASWRPK